MGGIALRFVAALIIVLDFIISADPPASTMRLYHLATGIDDLGRRFKLRPARTVSVTHDSIFLQCRLADRAGAERALVAMEDGDHP
jgi:hypothetical protein